MLVDDSTSYFSMSIFLPFKYFSKDIPCTLSYCQYSSTSTLTIAKFTFFAAQINKFDNYKISNLVSLFLVKRVDIAPNKIYLTCKNRISNLLLVFCNISFKASIKSTSNFCWLDTSHG